MIIMHNRNMPNEIHTYIKLHKKSISCDRIIFSTCPPTTTNICQQKNDQNAARLFYRTFCIVNLSIEICILCAYTLS